MAIPLPIVGRARVRRWLARGVVLASLLGSAGVALTSAVAVAVAAVETEEEQQRRAQEIIRTTMSPFCPGRTIDSCPSPYAADWRDDVRSWVAEGLTTEEIRKRLASRTPGGDLSGAPSTVLDAVLPILVTIVAVSALALLLRKLLAKRPPKPAPTKPRNTTEDQESLDKRLDEELAQLDE